VRGQAGGAGAENTVPKNSRAPRPGGVHRPDGAAAPGRAKSAAGRGSYGAPQSGAAIKTDAGPGEAKDGYKNKRDASAKPHTRKAIATAVPAAGGAGSASVTEGKKKTGIAVNPQPEKMRENLAPGARRPASDFGGQRKRNQKRGPAPANSRGQRQEARPVALRPEAGALGARHQGGQGRKKNENRAKNIPTSDVRRPTSDTGRDQVLQILQAVDRPVEVEELTRQLGQMEPEGLLLVLKDLEREGKVVRTRKNRYGVSKKMNLAAGALQAHPKGFAFLVPDDKGDDIYISKENLGGAMHGDRVVVRPLGFGSNGRRPEGEVIRVLERANGRVVGRFESDGGQVGFVVPDEKRLGWDILVPKSHLKGARNGDKVVVEVTRWPEARRNPEGRITEVFGASGEPGVDILSIVKKYGLPEEFPPRVLREADAIPQEITEEDADGRWDLRELPMVTIDGEDAKDLDDAVSLEMLAGGNYRLGVHIADVAFYVREGSELDQEAFQRGTSVYLVDRVIPMLPQRLSNGICSLNAGVDRLALSVFMEINNEGHVVRYDIGPAVIRVAERMTYTNVRRILEEHDEMLCQRYAGLTKTFEQMRDLCLLLRQRRHRRGALDFDFPECKVYLDESGRPQDVCLMEQSIANQIIEEFMLMANETVAKHLFHLEVPLLFRVHEEPKQEKLTALNEFLHGFGYHIPVSGGVHPRFFQEVLHQVEGKPEQLVVHTVMLRSLQHARYDSTPLGHFGLAVQFYAHFTSPIRRYPDLIVHRVLWEVFAHRSLTADRLETLGQQMQDNAKQSSKRELVAEEAERETVDLKKVEYIRQFMGEIFDGFVSSVTNFGMFIALPNGIEGLVHVSSMADDYYLFNDKNYTLTGEHTKKIFKIGDGVRVQLVRASLEDRQIDFELVAKPDAGRRNMDEE
jgi:ribonuclease R